MDDDKQYDYEVSWDKPIDVNPSVVVGFREVAIGDCGFGCKIYENRDHGLRVLAHNGAYGCRK